jgi:hypothetical protein
VQLILWELCKTVAAKGVESVKIEMNGDPKAGFTLIGAVTASGEKFPPFLIAKGLTQKCHKQSGQCFPGTIDHLKSGCESGRFLEALSFFRRNRGVNPIALILDQYLAHTFPLSRVRAEEPNIRMIFVPKCATAVYHPLDRRIYGVMKSKACPKFVRAISNGDSEAVTKESVAKLASECWIELTRENIISAWAIEGRESEDGRNVLGSENDDIVSEERSSSIECDIEYGHDASILKTLWQSKKRQATITKTTPNKRS